MNASIKALKGFAHSLKGSEESSRNTFLLNNLLALFYVLQSAVRSLRRESDKGGLSFLESYRPHKVRMINSPSYGISNCCIRLLIYAKNFLALQMAILNF